MLGIDVGPVPCARQALYHGATVLAYVVVLARVFKIVDTSRNIMSREGDYASLCCFFFFNKDMLLY